MRAGRLAPIVAPIASIASIASIALGAACWTGSSPPAEPVASEPAAAPASRFTITLERTACLGNCPVYRVTIRRDGRVEWHGEQGVAAVGERHGNVSPERLADLDRALAEVRFFERDGRGELEQSAVQCVKTGTTTTCSMHSRISICSDTARAIITVKRDGATHAVHNSHCDPSPLDALELLIDDVAGTRAWIGDRH